MLIPARFAATQKVNEDSASEILTKQRLQRPVSPHLSIYRPQITWYASSFNRITGITVSAGLYLFGFAYLAAPTLGWHLESQSLIATVAAWSVFTKASAKFAIAMPVVFHSLNGLRHLAWDVGYGFKNITVMRTGWAVVGLSTVLSAYLAFFH